MKLMSLDEGSLELSKVKGNLTGDLSKGGFTWVKEPKAEFEGIQKELKGSITWCEKGPQESAKKSCAHVFGGGWVAVCVCPRDRWKPTVEKAENQQAWRS